MLQRIILRLVLYLSIEKIMETNFRTLPIEQCRVVREIHFDYQYGRSWATAKIVYLRSFGITYERCFEAGTGCYPYDELDKLILDALTKKYDNVIVTDWLLLCDSHLERLNNIRKAAMEVIWVNVGADLSSVRLFDLLNIKQIDLIRFPLEVYINNRSTRLYFTGDVCGAYMPLREWREKIPVIRQLLKHSYSTLSKYLVSRW